MPNLCDLQITTPLTGYVQKTVSAQGEPTGLSVQARFTAGASVGDAVRVWIQTSVDGAASWVDVANFTFDGVSRAVAINVGATTETAAPFDILMGELSDNSIQSGILGPYVRAYISSYGTYGAGTSLKVDFVKRT